MFIEIKPLPKYASLWTVNTFNVSAHLKPATVYICKKAMSFPKYMHKQTAMVSIHCIGIKHMQFLNQKYRNQNKPTDVLSFPADTMPKDIQCTRHMGDIFICINYLKKQNRQMDFEAKFFHMVTHGTLHLLGYDHQTEQDAHVMQDIEAKVLQSFNIQNPYQSHPSTN